MYIFLCHCSLGPTMALFKLYIGGVWTGYGHNEVAQWLWESTSIQPLSIWLYSKGADATKQSAFVGYPTEGLARQALAILTQRPSMWGSRVTVLWSRDNPTTTADPDKATAPAASPSSASSRLLEFGMQAGPSFKSFADKGVQTAPEAAHQKDEGLQCGQPFAQRQDVQISPGQENELFPEGPSEQTVLVTPTERACSPTCGGTTDGSPTSPTSEAPTAVGELAEGTWQMAKRVRELAAAETGQGRKKLKTEVKSEKASSSDN